MGAFAADDAQAAVNLRLALNHSTVSYTHLTLPTTERV